MPWAHWGRAYTHTHTHTHTHTNLSLSCHKPMAMAWGELRKGARSLTNPLEGQSRGAPVLLLLLLLPPPSPLPPRAISTPAAQHSLGCLPLIWYFHKDDMRRRWSRTYPGSGESSFLTGVTFSLLRPASDLLTIQLNSTLQWVGAST